MTQQHPAANRPDAAGVIAAHLAATTCDDLPASTVRAAKIQILDVIACMLAGSTGPDVPAIRDLVTHRGGRPSATVLGGGGLKLPAESAVFLNAAMAHQHDFDDTHDVAVCHPSSASFPVALALAEERGGVSGRDFLTAVALGNDLTSRVALAIDGRLSDYPWFRAPVVGLFGATAAAAKILGADARQHEEALGLALPQVGGTLASLHHGGSSVRSIRDGLAYRNAVVAASLAMRGVRGDRAVFDGPFGYYQVFYRGEYSRDRLIGDLGQRYETDRISLKPWPSIRHLHALITALRDLMTAQNLAFADIDHVTAVVGTINQDRCRPTETGMVPARKIDLLGNLVFALGATILHGGPMLALYDDPVLADEVVTAAVPKIRWRHDPAKDGRWTFEPAEVEVATRDGRVFSHTGAVALGHPDRPVSDAARIDKLFACAGAAGWPVPEARVREIIDLVEGLERVGDVARLGALLG